MPYTCLGGASSGGPGGGADKADGDAVSLQTKRTGENPSGLQQERKGSVGIQFESNKQ